MPSIIPREFRLIDLTDPSTWHMATIQQWIALRDELRCQLGLDKDPTVRKREIADATSRAIAEFNRREGRKGRGSAWPWTGRQTALYAKLVAREMPEMTALDADDVEWAVEFLKSAEWLDRLVEAYKADNIQRGVVRALVERLYAIEPEIAGVRSEFRDRARASVSTSCGAGLPAGKNAYIPEPIELLQLKRLACLVTESLRDGISIAQDLQLSLDRYGAAYPCRRCRRKYERPDMAEACCSMQYAGDKRDDYYRAIVVGSSSHRRNLRFLLRLLWQFGYDTPIDLDDLVAWPTWSSITTSSTATFAEKLLGHLFSAKPETIRRRLARRELSIEYREFNIDPDLRDFQNRRLVSIGAELRPKGWYRVGPGQGVPGPHEGKRIFIAKWGGGVTYRSRAIERYFPRRREPGHGQGA